ncbi:hypothetical protein EDC04DRAFT_2869143 [Pisolithus marmoratus]|nr:hypothetical protein EDC04DRAFT_2869143 [Pisolithus marmoratus]
MHLPHSVFSQHQVDLLTWLLHINGVSDVPSVRTLKILEDGLQKICGIETLPFTGAFGHKYHMNSFSDIIAQEMANPHVHSKLHFYPEDSGKQLNEAYQAQRWLKEMDTTQLTPMIQLYNQDFFIFEPTLLSGGQVCMPIRWFQHKGMFFAKAWSLRAVVNDTRCGWIVEGHREIEISEAELLVSFKNWGVSQSTFALPPAQNIMGGLQLEPWTLTKPHEGNQWHALANGARVYSFPIWLYCDDTSGNLSKCWNKHNSFLFTPAGLPHAAVHQEYNVHFLCTSNNAPPLEMLDGFVNQLGEAQETGIWAWDCIHKERVLVIPSVLALLGDNPMQSELACHVGSMGKYFCCICNVKGHDSQEMTTTTADEQTQEHSGGERSDGQNSVRSGEEGFTPGTRKLRGKAKETMADMVAHIKWFVNVGEPHQKEQSIDELKSMFTMASSIGNQTKIKNIKTSTGLKDRYLDYFLDGMASSYKKKHGNSSKQQALEEFPCVAYQRYVKFSSCTKKKIKLKLTGLNPHSDTPVEVLHTVLLGFVKYFWRDAVNIRIGKNKIKKELLETHLSSFDTTGLEIPPLSGHTLVQYAGSLVGHDFWAIAQAAPFVLHGLVPDECYSTWVALSKLIPLIWQSEIDDIDVHLVKHIHWFGPAALFATEAFESFNAVIRAKSIHSN